MNNTFKLCLIRYKKLNIVVYKKLVLAIIVYTNKICSIIEYNVNVNVKFKLINNYKTNNRTEIVIIKDAKIEIETRELMKVFNTTNDYDNGKVEKKLKYIPSDIIEIKFEGKSIGFFILDIVKGSFNFNPSLINEQTGNLDLQKLL